MVDRVKRSAARNADDARVGYVVPALGSRVHSTIGELILFLNPTSRADLLAVFDNRASKDAIRRWIERRRIPRWAAETLAMKARHKFDARIADMRSTIGLGPGWNKGATRGLGEWRAKQNLQKRD